MSPSSLFVGGYASLYASLPPVSLLVVHCPYSRLLTVVHIWEKPLRKEGFLASQRPVSLLGKKGGSHEGLFPVLCQEEASHEGLFLVMPRRRPLMVVFFLFYAQEEASLGGFSCFMPRRMLPWWVFLPVLCPGGGSLVVYPSLVYCLVHPGDTLTGIYPGYLRGLNLGYAPCGAHGGTL